MGGQGASNLGELLAGAVFGYRRRAGFTQEELARRSGVSVRTVRSIETGRQRNPQLVSMRRLAEALSLSSGERDGLLAAVAGTPQPQPVVVPRQLPAAPKHFVGRHAELDELAPAWDGEPVCIVGPGGIGKTWLALRWAHLHLDRFPDGQLFVNLHGFDPASDPTAPQTALHGLLHALGVDLSAVPADPDIQVGLYRSLVADKRLLIMADNAATAEQVVPLLPGDSSCAVLITSRVWLPDLVAAHGARQVMLDVLPDADARALLADRLGPDTLAADPDGVAELLSCCAGLPLALSVLAAHAQLRQRGSLGAVAATVRTLGLDSLDEDGPSLAAALACSFRALTDAEGRLLMLLGCAPGPHIGLAAAAALAGVPEAEVQSLLHGLERASLLHQELDGRYRMHDVIRHYAAREADDRLPAAERDAAVRGLVEFYLLTAYRGDRLLAPHRPPIDPPRPGATGGADLPTDAAALAWFDAEHDCLLAAQQAAVTRRWDDLAWQLAWSLNRFHYRRGFVAADITVNRSAVMATERLGDPAALATALRLLGTALARTGATDEGLEQLTRSLTLAEQCGDVRAQASALHSLTVVRGLRDEDELAYGHAAAALALHRTLGAAGQEAEVLNSLGWYAARTGRYPEARVHCEAALELHRAARDVGSEAIVLDSLGYIDQRTGQHEAAVENYRQALALLERAGNTYQRVGTQEALGDAYAALGRGPEARTIWRAAVALAREQGRVADADRIQARLAAR